MPASDHEQQKAALKRATSIQAVRKAKEVAGWERRINQQVGRDGSKNFTGYPDLPNFAPGFPLNPVRRAEWSVTNATAIFASQESTRAHARIDQGVAVDNSLQAQITQNVSSLQSQISSLSQGKSDRGHSHSYEWTDQDRTFRGQTGTG